MDSTLSNLESLIKETGITLESNAKPKFLLIGTHAHQTTGYSKVTYNIIKEHGGELIIESEKNINDSTDV